MVEAEPGEGGDPARTGHVGGRPDDVLGQVGELDERLLAADEAGALPRQVVPRRRWDAQLRELVAEPGSDELEQPLRLVEVLEPVGPELAQPEQSEAVRGGCGGLGARQHLTAVRGADDAGGAVDGEVRPRRVVDDAAAALGRLVGVVSATTGVHQVLLGGDGADLAVVGYESLQAALDEHRDPWSRPVEITVRDQDAVAWARAAAGTAVQGFTAGPGWLAPA